MVQSQGQPRWRRISNSSGRRTNVRATGAGIVLTESRPSIALVHSGSSRCTGGITNGGRPRAPGLGAFLLRGGARWAGSPDGSSRRLARGRASAASVLSVRSSSSASGPVGTPRAGPADDAHRRRAPSSAAVARRLGRLSTGSSASVSVRSARSPRSGLTGLPGLTGLTVLSPDRISTLVGSSSGGSEWCSLRRRSDARVPDESSQAAAGLILAWGCPVCARGSCERASRARNGGGSPTSSERRSLAATSWGRWASAATTAQDHKSQAPSERHWKSCPSPSLPPR